MNKMSYQMQDIKKLEAELNEQLYNMIFALTLEYPTTSEFNKYFKKDMFTKNNKAACHHILHFLLNTLDPIAFKKKITWPLLDVKMEARFMNEVIKYINELSVLHEDSGLPNLAKSHLQSAGGYKFIKFMNSVTQFVLYEVLKRSDEGTDIVMLRTKENVIDTSISSEKIKNLENMVNNLYIQIGTEQTEFNENYNVVKQIAEELNNEKMKIDQLFLETKFQEKEIDKKISSELQALGEIQEFEAMNLKLKQQLKLLKMKENTISNCAELIDVLQTNKNFIKLDKSNLKSMNVSLLHYLESFYNVIKVNKHLCNYGTKTDFTEEFETINESSEKLKETLCKYEFLNSELLQFSAHLEDIVSNSKYNDNDNLDNSNASVLMGNIKKIYEPIPGCKVGDF